MQHSLQRGALFALSKFHCDLSDALDILYAEEYACIFLFPWAVLPTQTYYKILTVSRKC